MNRSSVSARLLHSRQRIAEVEAQIVRQRDILKRYRSLGLDTAECEQAWALREQTLTLYLLEGDRILAELAAEDPATAETLSALG